MPIWPHNKAVLVGHGRVPAAVVPFPVRQKYVGNRIVLMLAENGPYVSYSARRAPPARVRHPVRYGRTAYEPGEAGWAVS